MMTCEPFGRKHCFLQNEWSCPINVWVVEVVVDAHVVGRQHPSLGSFCEFMGCWPVSVDRSTDHTHASKTVSIMDCMDS